MIDFDASFPRYTGFSPEVPVWCVTPDVTGCIHHFFDTSPVSPSGRYLGLTRLPAEDRLPAPDERAEVVVVDLETGEPQTVADIGCFDVQLGANVQWGSSDQASPSLMACVSIHRRGNAQT